MNEIESQGSGFDTVKLLLALIVLTGAIAGFYYFADQSMLYRVGGLFAAVIVSGLIAAQTYRGRQILDFMRDAQIEVRKVVWPNRQETIQTTLAVVLMVVAVAMFLWLLDILLGWGLRAITGPGS
jgi:preprotein translocase subunit SecE